MRIVGEMSGNLNNPLDLIAGGRLAFVQHWIALQLFASFTQAFSAVKSDDSLFIQGVVEILGDFDSP